jgi:excisionase family DNA binding protein
MADSVIEGVIYDRPKQAQRKLGIGPTKFYELVAEGRIKTLKLGRATLVPTDQYQAFRESLEKHAALGTV